MGPWDGTPNRQYSYEVQFCEFRPYAPKVKHACTPYRINFKRHYVIIVFERFPMVIAKFI
jgi:hypothetical protein